MIKKMQNKTIRADNYCNSNYQCNNNTCYDEPNNICEPLCAGVIGYNLAHCSKINLDQLKNSRLKCNIPIGAIIRTQLIETIMCDMKLLATIACDYDGIMFGGIVRDFILRSIDTSDIDMWFKNEESLAQYIECIKNKVTLEETPFAENSKAYLFKLHRYILHIECRSYLIDFVVSDKFPVNDFNINCLTYNGIDIGVYDFCPCNKYCNLEFILKELFCDGLPKCYMFPEYDASVHSNKFLNMIRSRRIQKFRLKYNINKMR